MSLMKDHQHGGRDKESPYVIASSVRSAVASPVPVDTVRRVGHTAVLVVGSGLAAHLPGRSLASSELPDVLAHIFDRGSVVVE